MEEYKEPTQEEIKAERYVSCYYFWQYQYLSRYTDSIFGKDPYHILEYDPDGWMLKVETEKNLPRLRTHEGAEVRENEWFDLVLEYGSIFEAIVNNYHMEVVRESSNYGVSLVGFEDVLVRENGSLAGTILASINISAPLNILTQEIKRIKDASFTQPVSFSIVQKFLHYEGTDYVLERKYIESRDGVSFSPDEDSPRIIGLWLYDVIDDKRQYDSVSSAYKDLKNNEEYFFCDPPRSILDILGYAASEPSVLRRIYRNTKKCIEACEVLSLKD